MPLTALAAVVVVVAASAAAAAAAPAERGYELVTPPDKGGAARFGFGTSILMLFGSLLACVLCLTPSARAADNCPNAEIRAQQGASHLPDCRAYEMVSPPAKNGYDVRWTATKTRSSVTGDAVTFNGVGTFPGTGAKGSGGTPRYFAQRTSAGWTTTSIDPPHDAHHFAAGGPIYWDPQSSGAFSPDLEFSAVTNFNSLLAPGALPDRIELYRRHTMGSDYELVSKSMVDPPPPPPVGGGSLALWVNVGTPLVTATSEDLEHIVFETNLNLLPAATGTSAKSYEWEDGELRLVGILPDGNAAASATLGPSLGFGSVVRKETASAMSADGSRIYFTSHPDSRLYLRENGGRSDARTIWISESEKESPDAPQPALFREASRDGSTVFFTTSEQLLDEDDNAGEDLYAYRLAAPEGDRLTLLSRDEEPADGHAAGALGVLAASEDGSRVYFAASGQLVGGEPTGPMDKIYLWEDGSVRYVATFAANSTSFRNDLNWTEDQSGAGANRTATTTADGSYLLFQEDLRDWYLYDLAEDEVKCVSCDPSGVPAQDQGNLLTLASAEVQMFTDTYRPRNLLVRDGAAKVYFSTARALSVADVNGKIDVYEYDDEDGSISLISSGKSSDHSYFLDANPDGRDVFFATRERLSEWDVDDNRDVYDARIGGGLPGPPRAVVRCEQDACQGPAASRPVPPTIGSVTFGGDGNLPLRSDPVKASVGVARLKRVTGLAAKLRVRVPDAGRITVRGPWVRRVVRSAGKAGVYRLRIVLRSRARKLLRKRKRLKVNVRVSYRAKDGQSASKVIKVTFKQSRLRRAKAKKGGR